MAWSGWCNVMAVEGFCGEEAGAGSKCSLNLMLGIKWTSDGYHENQFGKTTEEEMGGFFSLISNTHLPLPRIYGHFRTRIWDIAIIMSLMTSHEFVRIRYECCKITC